MPSVWIKPGRCNALNRIEQDKQEDADGDHDCIDGSPAILRVRRKNKCPHPYLIPIKLGVPMIRTSSAVRGLAATDGHREMKLVFGDFRQ